MVHVESVKKQLERLRERYGSLESLAEALRRFPEFTDLNRATLSRWLNTPTPRASVAVRLLTESRPQVRLRIAQNNALSLLPSLMLMWEPRRNAQYGTLRSRHNVIPEQVTGRFGGDALSYLNHGEADIGLIPGDFVHQLGSQCKTLCLLTRLAITGFSTTPIDTVHNLKGKVFGFLASSGFGRRLDHLSRTWGVSLKAPVALETPLDCAKALREGVIAGVAGSEPSVSRIRHLVEKKMSVYPVTPGLLGSFDMHVAVNLTTCEPRAVRAYLIGLQETVRYCNARKSVAAFQAEVASRFEMEVSDVTNVLAHTRFTGDEYGSALLTLWEREAAGLRGDSSHSIMLK